MKNPPPLEAPAYSIGAAATLLLTVTVGTAQMGTSGVWIDEQSHSKGDYTKTPIGKGSDLAGKQVRIKTIVTDINSFSKKMAVTYLVEGGSKKFQKTVPWEVDEIGDTAVFRATVPVVLA